MKDFRKVCKSIFLLSLHVPKSQLFFPILILIVLTYFIWETSRNKLKKHSVSNKLIGPENSTNTFAFVSRASRTMAWCLKNWVFVAIIGYYIGLLEVPRKLVFSLAHAHVGDYYMDVRSFCFQWWWLKTLHSVQCSGIIHIFKFPKCIFANFKDLLISIHQTN